MPHSADREVHGFIAEMSVKKGQAHWSSFWAGMRRSRLWPLTLLGFNYETNLTIFPAITKDLWGLRNFGVNYGLVFTSWGVGGFFFSRLYQMIESASGGETAQAFLVSGAFRFVGKHRQRGSEQSPESRLWRYKASGPLCVESVVVPKPGDEQKSG